MTDAAAPKKAYVPLIPGPAKCMLTDSGITGEDRFAIKVKITKAEGACASNLGKTTTWSGRFVGEGTKYALDTLEGFGFDIDKMDLVDFHPEKIHEGKEFEIEVSNYTLPAKDGQPEKKFDQVKYFKFEGRGNYGLEKIKLSEVEAKNVSESLMARMRAAKNGSTDGASGSSGEAPNTFQMDKKEDLPF